MFIKRIQCRFINFYIGSELTIKTPERRQRRSGVFIVNFEHIQ